jgi:hypothetical protein
LCLCSFLSIATHMTHVDSSTSAFLPLPKTHRNPNQEKRK